ncbi:hypothetical protein M2459_000933 [Parabacteroides sp. PF5-5]|nr:hypothetical protein [Parabacteroides sp. PH5-39]MDH6318740.1 hypothetical protein [Parabacteroides sp. PH5-13]MDH6326395.1 hypothetical protein [Parabacteroides sp. PH5-41]MDH6334195.1 hypothetical protein [Parabacteroides sp. PF5-5]MDH6360216.1 hypothetical protein [Parabacteroides sp. PH5-16]MDH6383705.1 hypothetical protein [Parabacteroides sp. PH5-17]MDH6406171.1 hypothetical protein [Parabacteroides sp. PH5-26]
MHEKRCIFEVCYYLFYTFYYANEYHLLPTVVFPKCFSSVAQTPQKH